MTKFFGTLSARRVVWGLCALLLFVIAVDQVQRSLEFLVDDAYITFSFSKNLGTGHGPVFSHGVRVEGYSNFLWMVVVALRFLFVHAGDPLGFARVVAFGCLAGTFFMVYRLVRREAGPGPALSALGLLVCCSDLFRGAASGLETVPFSTAILFGWYVYLGEPPGERRWSALAFVPAALMRIDGFVPLLIVLGVELLSALGEGRFTFAKFFRWAGPALVLWATYFLWRYRYYGLLLPTTYYAKTVVTKGDADRGFRQAFDFVRDYGALALMPLATVPLVRGPWRGAAGLTMAVLLQVGYAINVGGDWMPFNRFFLPIVPLFVVLVGWGFGHAWRISGKSAWPTCWMARILLTAALCFSCVHMHIASIDSPQENDKLGSAVHSGDHTQHNLLDIADMMALVVRRPGDHLVTDYAGVFSVFTDAAVIDMWGLCTADIALNGGTDGINPIYGKSCAECYTRLHPDYFHVGVPIVRGADSLHSVNDVLSNVFQGYAIDRYIHIRENFAAGRVVKEATGQALWFLERRRPELPLVTRRPAPGMRVDYPFEPSREPGAAN